MTKDIQALSKSTINPASNSGADNVASARPEGNSFGVTRDTEQGAAWEYPEKQEGLGAAWVLVGFVIACGAGLLMLVFLQ